MRLLLLAILLPNVVFSQIRPETYDIRNPGENLQKKCEEYLDIFSRLPVEVRYGVDIQDRNIYFYIPGKRYFDLIFDRESDGIAVDIIRREQYKCYEQNNFARSWANRGHLMPPMYKEEMVQNSIDNGQGFIIVKYGELPKGFDPNNIECNLLVLQKKYLCGYHSFSNLNYSNWGLLETGLYRDSLSGENLQEVHKEISKTLRFTIPFERNKSTFNQDDIQPLYDSLQLTDYNIKELTIKAYTSVEGPLKRNIELQKERSQSIIQALQSFQTPEIISNVSVNENWVEFLNDITGTRFEYLARMTKEEIKAELEKEDVLENIGPVLKPHRKALIELKLQKRFTSQENNPEVLRTFFDQYIEKRNIREALYLQSVILEKVKEGQLPSDFIGQLEVPEESAYGPLLNNFAIFNYESNDIFLYENITNFEKLRQILPESVKIMYNLTALKLKAWTQGELITNRGDIEKSLEQLEKMGLERSLLTRLKVNYNMILTQYHELKNDYINKARALKEVYWLYSKLDLNDQDLLSLAKYLAVYSKFSWATRVLSARINDVDVSEDLIYYYLRLTINKPETTRQLKYRTFMLNAIDKNKERFCNLFLPKSQGGYTFQLLDDEFLRKTYCENCYKPDK